MEPLTTTVAISTIVGYLAKKLKDNKSVQGFFNDFTEATVNWIKPIFVKEDGTSKDVLKDLQDNPDDEDQQAIAKSTITKAIKKNPTDEQYLQQMVEIIQKKDPSLVETNTIIIKGNSNKTYQDITGSTITDNSITQKHSGKGDIVGGDKVRGDKVGGNKTSYRK